MLFSALIGVAMIGQNPAQPPARKASVLAGKPWWEKLKPGDVIKLETVPGTVIPLVKMWRSSDEENRIVREDLYAGLFARLAASGDWAELHKMVDRSHIHYAYSGTWVQVVAIRNDPDLKCPVAEVIDLGMGIIVNGIVTDGSSPPKAESPRGAYGIYYLPVPYLGGEDRLQHPRMSNFPVLAHRSKDTSKVNCQEVGCAHMEAIPYAEAERAWKERQRRTEEAKRRGEEEARRRKAAERLKSLPKE